MQVVNTAQRSAVRFAPYVAAALTAAFVFGLGFVAGGLATALEVAASCV